MSAGQQTRARARGRLAIRALTGAAVVAGALAMAWDASARSNRGGYSRNGFGFSMPGSSSMPRFTAPQAPVYSAPAPTPRFSAPQATVRTQPQSQTSQGNNRDNSRAQDDDDDDDSNESGRRDDLANDDNLGDPTAPPRSASGNGPALSDAERKALVARHREEAAREARLRARDERIARSHKAALVPLPRQTPDARDRLLRDAEQRAKAQVEWSRRDKAEAAKDRADDAGWETRAVRVKDEPADAKPDDPVIAGGLDEPKRGRVQWLKGLQRQASKLGMGDDDDDGKPAAAPVTGDGAPGEGSSSTVPDPKVSGAKPSDAKSEPGGPRSRPDARDRIADGKLPRGRGAGAELPPAAFVKDRAQELVATGLSAVDVEAVKKLGFSAAETVVAGAKAPLQRLRAPSGMNRDEAERLLHKTLPFLAVTPNYGYSIIVSGESVPATGGPSRAGGSSVPASSRPCPNDTCFGSRLINWKSTLNSCTKGVRIGIIDTSFDLEHPALRHIKAEQGEFLDGQSPSPYDWHGTAVLSLLAGDPASGTPGLAPDATYLLATAFRSDTAGNASTDTVRLIAALSWLEELKVEFVNMSFSGPQDPAIEQIIERMRKNGVVFVAAAGNMGPAAAPSYPAAYPSVIAVTAINRRGDNYWNANRGNYIDVSAPGVDILTALPDGQQGYRTGTSFAAPFVTAIVASRAGDAMLGGPKSRLFAGAAIRDLGPPGRDPIYGSGLALAPPRCAREPGAVAQGETVPSLPWGSTTTTSAGEAGAAPGDVTGRPASFSSSGAPADAAALRRDVAAHPDR